MRLATLELKSDGDAVCPRSLCGRARDHRWLITPSAGVTRGGVKDSEPTMRLRASARMGPDKLAHTKLSKALLTQNRHPDYVGGPRKSVGTPVQRLSHGFLKPPDRVVRLGTAYTPTTLSQKEDKPVCEQKRNHP